MRTLLAMLLAVLLALPMGAAQYYISTSGSDTNNGTSVNTPWLTFTNAYAHMVSGDVSSLDSTGTFTGPLVGFSGMTWNSYGSGQAIIMGNTNNGAFAATNVNNLLLSNLDFSTPRPDTNDDAGFDLWCVRLLAKTTNNTRYTNDAIANCLITGAENGILVDATDTNYVDGYYNLRIVDNVISNCTDDGIEFNVDNYRPVSYGFGGTFQFGGIYIGSNFLTYIIGQTANPSGDPIQVYNCYGGLVESNIIENSGQSNNYVGPGGGPAGYAVAGSEYVTNQYNWVSNICARLNNGSPVDGDGYDFDMQTYHCVSQYNYVTHCGGPGLYSFDYGGGNGNIMRFNIAVSNAVTFNSDCVLQGNYEQFYNNTIIGQGNCISTLDEKGGIVENNIFTTGFSTVTLFSGSTIAINNIVSAAAGLPPWLNAAYYPLPQGPAYLSAIYMPNNGGKDYYGNPLGSHGYNIGAVNGNTGPINYISFIMSTIGPSGVSFPNTLAWYQLNEGSGAVANDRSGNGYNGALVDGPTWVNPVGLAFNGINQQVICTNFADNLSNMTIVCWIKFDSGDGITNDSAVFGKMQAAGNNPGWALLVNDTGPAGSVDFQLVDANNGNSYEVFSSGGLNDGNWHLAVVTVSSNVPTLYIDGSLDNNIDSSQTITTFANTNNVQFGLCGTYNFYSGSVGETRIYPAVLSSSQILALYSAGQQ